MKHHGNANPNDGREQRNENLESGPQAQGEQAWPPLCFEELVFNFEVLSLDL